MKKTVRIATAFILILTLVATGCSGANQTDTDDDGRISIITTLFPLYDFARHIAGEKAEVSLILPPGAEPHSYEPSPGDILKIGNADVFVYTGKYMEPWAQRILDTVNSDDLIVVDSSKGIHMMDHEHGDHSHDESHHHQSHDESHHQSHDESHHQSHDESHHHSHDESHHHSHDESHHHSHDESHHHHSHEGKDPHIWTDPISAKRMAENIYLGLVEADPENESYYESNLIEYKDKLDKLDADIRQMLEKSENDTIIAGGHFAFGYFAKRYSLEYISPYRGFSPNAEPAASDIANLIDTLESLDTKVIYYEELIDPKVARVISEQTGAKMLLLHGVHNVSREELEQGVTYIDIMYGNLENLKEGLGYRE